MNCGRNNKDYKKKTCLYWLRKLKFPTFEGTSFMTKTRPERSPNTQHFWIVKEIYFHYHEDYEP